MPSSWMVHLPQKESQGTEDGFAWWTGHEQSVDRLAGRGATAGGHIEHLLLEKVPLSPARHPRALFCIVHPPLAHERRILKGDQNLELIRLHEKRGHFVRIAPNEVSVSHPDALKKILLTPLRKGDWYKIVHFPDRRYRNPMGETDPATKNELSRHLAAGYLLTNLLQAEPAVDDTVELLLGWLDRHAEERKPTAASNAVAAGADTVACGLQAFVYHMIRRPDLWSRVREEVDTAGLTAPGSRQKVVPYAEAKRLPLLQACIKEALRLFGPAPMGLPRVVGEAGVTIGNRTFPEGTILSVSAWVMHHSREIWGEDAGEFRPERWLDDDKSAALDKHYMPVSIHGPPQFGYVVPSGFSNSHPHSLGLDICPVQVRTSQRSSCPRSLQP